MTVENEHRDDNKTLREFYEATGSKGVLWIDDRTGRIVDEVEVETRIRSGEGGCQLCHEELDGREAHGEVQFDEHGLPRYAIAAPRTRPIDVAAEVIDLVGAPPRLPAIGYVPNNGRAPSIAQQARRLLTGKGGGR